MVTFIHSFKDLYGTSSGKLLRGAPDSIAVKNNSFRVVIECLRECDLGKRRSARGRPFHTVGPCMITCDQTLRIRT